MLKKYYPLLVLSLGFSCVSFAESSLPVDDLLKRNEALFASLQQIEPSTQIYASEQAAVALVPVAKRNSKAQVARIQSLMKWEVGSEFFDLAHSTSSSRFLAQLKNPGSAVAYLIGLVRWLSWAQFFYRQLGRGTDGMINGMESDKGMADFIGTKLLGPLADVASLYYLIEAAGASKLKLQQSSGRGRLPPSSFFSRLLAQLRNPRSGLAYLISLSRTLALPWVFSIKGGQMARGIIGGREFVQSVQEVLTDRLGTLADVAALYYLFDRSGARRLEFEQSVAQIYKESSEASSVAVVVVPQEEIDTFKAQLGKMGFTSP
jgi:hypothetical protein